jgi:molybdenum cofactor cytidylyltransferase
MGQPKALLPIGEDGDTFFDRVTATLLEAGVSHVVVVAGADAVAIRQKARPRPGVAIVDNPNFDRGQLTSLLAGLNAIDHLAPNAVLVTLIDVPLVSVDTVRALLATSSRSGAPIIRPVSNGRHGHPVIFGRALFDELRRADLQQGAKQVVRAHAAEILEIEIEDEGAFTDIDTPEDYDKLITRSGGRR